MENDKTTSKFLATESYLRSFFRECSIKTIKFHHSNNYLVRVSGPNGRLKHHLIFYFRFVDENPSDEVIEKLKDWCLQDVLKKAGTNVISISNDGIRNTL